MEKALSWRRMAFALVLLFLLGGVSDRILSGDSAGSSILFGITPLVLLYALGLQRIRLIQWFGFVLMLQFITCVLRLFMPGLLLLRLFTLLCCVMAFIAVMYYINRHRKPLTAVSVSASSAPEDQTP